MGLASGQIPFTKLRDLSRTQLQRNMKTNYTSLLWQWSSCLGEAYINLSDYADALKPVSATLPLEGCKFGTILHVSIQLLTSKTGFREFEVQREIREKSFHQISNPCHEPVREVGDSSNKIMDTVVNTQVRLTQESGELYYSDETEDSGQGIYNSSVTSDGLYAERVEISSTNSSGAATNTIEGNPGDQIHNNHGGSSNPHLAHGWSSYFSKDSQVNLLNDEMVESSMEVNSSKQFANESGEAFFEEVPVLKSECSTLKDELEVLRHYKPMLHLSGRRTELSHIPNSFHEYQPQILEGFTLLERKIEILRSKVRSKENGDIPPDFEDLDFVLQNLRQCILNSLRLDPGLAVGVNLANPLQSLLDQELENKKIMNERICQLLTQLEDSKAKQETLTRTINKKIVRYDALIVELEERNGQTLSELERIKSAHSSSLSTILVLQDEIKKIQCSTKEKIVKFSEEKQRLEAINKELEERVIASESMLKRVRRTQSTVVDQLQKDLESLSAQVLSMFETNENLAKQILEEAPKLLSCENPKPPIFADKSNHLECHQDPCSALRASDMLVRNFENGGISGSEEEFHDLHALNLHLEVLVKLLQEKLLERSLFEKDTMTKMDDLLKSERSLMINLKNALDGIRVLDEDVARYKAKAEDWRGEKNILESRLQESCQQNSSIAENLAKYERLVNDLKICEQRYIEENSHLKSMLKEESLQKSHVEKECVLLKAELDEKSIALHDIQRKIDLFEERLRNVLSNMEQYVSQMKGSNFEFCSILNSLSEEIENRDYSATVELVEQLQREAFKKILDLRKEITEKDEETCSLTVLLKERSSELEETTSKLDVSSLLLEKLHLDLQSKAESEQNLADRNKDLVSKLTIMEYKLKDAFDEMRDNSKIREELERAQHKIVKYQGEEESWVLSLDSTKESSVLLEKEIRDLRNELKTERTTKKKLEETVSNLTSRLNENETMASHLGLQLSELESENSSLENRRQYLEEKLNDRDGEMSSLQKQIAENLKDLSIVNEALRSRSDELQNAKLHSRALEDQIADLMSQILSLDGLNSELAHLKRQIIDLESKKSSSEKQEAQISNLQFQIVYLDTELCKAREKLGCLRDELQSERETRGNLEGTVSDLTSLLKETQAQVVYFSNEMVLLENLRQQMLTLETEKSTVDKLLISSTERINELDSEISNLQSQLMSERDFRFQMDSTISELQEQLPSKKDEKNGLTCFRQQVLNLKSEKEDIEREASELLSLLNEKDQYIEAFKKDEAELKDLKKRLMKMEDQQEIAMELRSALSAVTSRLDEKQEQLILLERVIADIKLENSEMQELALSAIIEATFLKTQYQKNIQELLDQIIRNEGRNKDLQKEVEAFKLLREFEEMESIWSSKEEHAIVGTVLQSTLIEQCEQIFLLQEETKALLDKLSELNLKTEEYKNLSILLSKQIKEKKESSVAAESLRVAFIREKFESRVHDLQLQLDISKKHEEDLLLKLQNAVDEVELRKKSEASQARVNEELLSRISELETDRCELVKAYDEIRTELECSAINAECWEEERLKMESSLRERNQEVEKLRAELESVQRHLEQLTSELRKPVCGEDEPRKAPTVDISEEEATALQRNDLDVSISGRTCLVSHSKEKPSEDWLLSLKIPANGNFPSENTDYAVDIEDQRREQENLKAGIKRLKEELDRIKNENLESPLSEVGQELLDPSLRGLEKKFLQLEMANRNLGTLFPSLQDPPCSSGSALERVLALELELAEALQAKKPDSAFQSSFARPPGDDVAVLRSFRDINELIGDVLNAKGRHAAMESELNDMHSRFSQLSLQLAEVEGERQKLLMKLKNSRSPRKS
ncbi:sporulation-specific protein isoform X2 [Wolffia australiana]